MKKVFLIFTTLTSTISLYSGELPSDSLKQVRLEEIVVSSTRVGNNTPMAYSNMSATQIKKDNAGKNIPFILQTMPSVVAFSEDGSGVGNTSLRIRGTDATRINVTLNGMPLNNPESQEVFWVNIPDLSNSLQSIQLQRGIGTSTNGTAAFGASLSLKTIGYQQEAYGQASSAIGSYNTFSSSIAAGTGVLKNRLSLDLRYSRVTGDGYIRNGKVNHKSGYASLSHYTDNQMIKLIYINGIQHTGITWEGISEEQLKKDRRYNPAGKYYDDAGNIHYYDNETDNYYSNILQLIYSKEFSPKFSLNFNMSYNNGYGYYENYKSDRSFYDEFRLPNQITNDGVEHSKSDVIRRKLLSNNYYVQSVSLSYFYQNLSLIGGLNHSYFDGNHYGKLRWIKYNQNIKNNYEWYRNNSDKQDIAGFLKAEYKLLEGKLMLLGDIQYKYIDYRMKGIDDDFADINSNHYYSFFNPKVGASFNINDNNNVYASFAMANREPLRSDLKESIKGGGKSIKSEKMYDYELGYRFSNNQASFNINLYYMNYKDQMVQTGRLNDVGYKLMENVPESYRAGIELIGAYRFTKWIRLDANATFSKNKIKNYTAYFDLFPLGEEEVKEGAQVSEFKKNTNISYSPNIVGSGILTISPIKDFNIAIIGKFVGKQYFDNTSNKDIQLPSYFVNNLSLGYTFNIKNTAKADVQFFVNNVLNRRYVANASVYTARFTDGSPYIEKYFYPQATRNIMGKLAIQF